MNEVTVNCVLSGVNRLLSSLCRTYTREELTALPGDRRLREDAFRPFLTDLHEGKLVFRDQFTALVEVVAMELTERGFEMEVRSLATIRRRDRGVISRLPERWRFGNTWDHCTLNIGLLAVDNHPAGFCLWPEADLVRQVEECAVAGELAAAEDLLQGRISPRSRHSQVA